MKIKTLLATCLLLFGLQASAETIDGQNIISSDLNNSSGKITNCQFSSSAIKSGDKIDLDSIEIKPTICNKDVLYNMKNGLFGNVDLAAKSIGLRDMEKNVGYDVEMQGSLFFQQVVGYLKAAYYFVFSIAGIWALYYTFVPKGDDAAESHRPTMVLVGLGLITFLYAFMRMGFLWAVGVANMMGVSGVINELKTFDVESQVITPQDEMRITTNTNQMIAMKFAKEQTTMASFSKAFSAVSKNQAAFFSLDKNYSPKELMENIKEFNTYDMDLTRYYTPGFDITKPSDMLNPNILVNSYDIIKSAPFLDSNKAALSSYPALLGSIEVNTNGIDFEDLSSESLNDGVLKNHLNNTLVDSIPLNLQLKSDVEELSAKIYAHLKDGQPFFTDDYARNSFLSEINKSQQDRVMGQTKQIVQKNRNLDALSMKNPSSTGPLVSGLFYANVFAAVQGHDKTGAGIARILDMQTKVYEAEKNKTCTLNWSQNEAVRAFVKAFNALPDKALYDLSRDPAYSAIKLSPGFNCIGFNATKMELFNFGSPTMADVNEYRMIELAHKAAFDIAIRNYFIAIKKAMNSEKSMYNELIGEILEVTQLGVIGSIGLVQQKLSLFKKNELMKSSMIANAITWSFRNANGDETNYLIHNALNEKVTTDNLEKINKDSLVEFPAINLANLNVVGVMNVSPSRLDDTSMLSAQNLKVLIFKMIALDPIAIKLYLGTDPNKSLPEGAKECMDKPDICKLRVKTPLGQAVNEMGMSWVDWAEGLLVAKFILGGATVAIDTLPDVTMKVMGMVGEDGVKGQIKTGLKFMMNFVGKILIIALQTANVILSLLMPIVIVMLMAGLFVGYIIPIMMILIFINIFIALLTNMAGKEALSLPIRVMRLPLMPKDQAWGEVWNIVNDVLALIFTIIFATFFASLSRYMIDTIDVSRPGIYLIATSDNTLIGGLMGLVSFFFLCVFIVISLINSIMPNTEKALHAAFKQNEKNKDEMISNLNKLLANPRFYDAMQVASNAMGGVSKELGNVAKKHRRNSYEQKRKLFKQAANQSSQGTEGSND